MIRRIYSTTALLALTAAAVLGCTCALAQTVDLNDPLQAFCYGTTACAGNGTVTPTATNPPQFGFTSSTGRQTGDYIIDVLVPDNEALPANYSITGTQGGIHDNQSISSKATEVSSTAWTSGNLGKYLGIGASASPTNALSSWLDYTQANDDPGATGYYVFQVNLGETTLQSNSNALSGPLLNIGTLDPGTVITGFLNTGSSWSPNYLGTTSKGALYLDHHRVPEPDTLGLIGVALAGFGVSALTRRRKASAPRAGA